MKPDLTLSAALLVGGKSTRMGRDKVILPWKDNLPLWQHQLKTLKQLHPRELFFAGQHPELMKSGIATTLPDAELGRGPMSGLASALITMQTTHLLLLSVDLPFMTAAYLNALWQRCSLSQGIVPFQKQYGEPLAAIYPREIAPLVTAQTTQNEFSLQKLLIKGLEKKILISHSILDSELPLFTNLNSPSDLL